MWLICGARKATLLLAGNLKFIRANTFKVNAPTDF